MRLLMRVTLPVETGNAIHKSGEMGPLVQRLLSEAKPEAAYFLLDDDGQRTALIVADFADNIAVPKAAEPWVLALNARVTLHPVMTAQDFAAAAPTIDAAVAAYAR